MAHGTDRSDIGTSRDTITLAALHHQPIVDAYLAQPIKLEHHTFAADHAVSDLRLALARAVVKFPGKHLRSPQ
jgi:uncharacterized protein